MHRHGLTWIILFAVIALMFIQLPQMAARQDSIVHKYSALVEVDALVSQNYVAPVLDERLVDGAIRGMLFTLDPYSGYIGPRELPAFQRRTSGDFIGVGVELGMRDGMPTIIAPIEGGPAQDAGVLPGDVLMAVDGCDVKGLSVFDLEERMGGRPGSVVRLTIRRSASTNPWEISVRRGPVTIESVRGFDRSANGDWRFQFESDLEVGYIRITSFHERTVEEFDRVLASLRKSGVKGLVLDLRSNPGGLMHQAIEICDRFLSSGLIVETITRRKAVHEYFAWEPDTIEDWPIAVLINAGSASAAEIVAGALQDHHRAVIVGQRSFGKGSVQHLMYLSGHEAALKLTVAWYRLPSGRLIHRGAGATEFDEWGIRPDLEMECLRDPGMGKAADHANLDSPTALAVVDEPMLAAAKIVRDRIGVR